VPSGMAAFAYTLDADVEVDGETLTTIRIPTECRRTSLSCRSDADCGSVGVDTEMVCVKGRLDHERGVCDLKDATAIDRGFTPGG
jgi:hypothetical protein